MSNPNRPYVICPHPACPEYDNLHGWRAWLNKWLGIEFRRARFVLFGPERRLYCAPATVPVVKRWLEQRRLAYVVETKLTALPGGNARDAD